MTGDDGSLHPLQEAHSAYCPVATAPWRIEKLSSSTGRVHVELHRRELFVDGAPRSYWQPRIRYSRTADRSAGCARSQHRSLNCFVRVSVARMCKAYWVYNRCRQGICLSALIS